MDPARPKSRSSRCAAKIGILPTSEEGSSSENTSHVARLWFSTASSSPNSVTSPHRWGPAPWAAARLPAFASSRCVEKMSDGSGGFPHLVAIPTVVLWGSVANMPLSSCSGSGQSAVSQLNSGGAGQGADLLGPVLASARGLSAPAPAPVPAGSPRGVASSSDSSSQMDAGVPRCFSFAATCSHCVMLRTGAPRVRQPLRYHPPVVRRLPGGLLDLGVLEGLVQGGKGLLRRRHEGGPGNLGAGGAGGAAVGAGLGCPPR
mmetsp:Transcript_39259/g.88230  ORF Transcript_39259/g.88230 Transcript_39259/m.88230 type:complete len:260 (+) Transcript_39259:1526-2305(+)